MSVRLVESPKGKEMPITLVEFLKGKEMPIMLVDFCQGNICFSFFFAVERSNAPAAASPQFCFSYHPKD